MPKTPNFIETARVTTRQAVLAAVRRQEAQVPALIDTALTRVMANADKGRWTVACPFYDPAVRRRLEDVSVPALQAAIKRLEDEGFDIIYPTKDITDAVIARGLPEGLLAKWVLVNITVSWYPSEGASTPNSQAEKESR